MDLSAETKNDENLPEFHRNGQEMTKCLEIFGKNARKIRKMPEISGIGEKFHSSFHFFNPLLTERSSSDGRVDRLLREARRLREA